jgi:glycosyltransferase involved in cell wall biosynthesis
MRVLALAPFPVEAAATRFRLVQLSAPLAQRGIDLTIHPFLDADTYSTLYDRTAWLRTTRGLLKAAGRRLRDVKQARDYDCLLVQREAMLFGPPLVETLASRGRSHLPLVLDLDDATYVAYDSPTYGRFARWLKWPAKTDRLIDMAAMVTCGNNTVADYVTARGTPATIVPTVVDLDTWMPRPRQRNNTPPVIGWIGSHSTFPYLEAIAPALQQLAKEHAYKLLVVGAGQRQPNAKPIAIEGVDVDSRPWRLDRELQDFQEIDIGLYPLPADDPWAAGKSGFKAVQYMAVGVPYVASPIGAAHDIGEHNETHLLAHTHDEWRQALATLLTDPDRRARMGKKGRAHAQANYTLDHAVDPLADAIQRAGSRPPDE